VSINEYNTALQIDPNHARSLYGRGLAKTRSGDRQGGSTDMAAAMKIAPKVAEDFSRLGMK
jgi:hypothetical protein